MQAGRFLRRCQEALEKGCDQKSVERAISEYIEVVQFAKDKVRDIKEKEGFNHLINVSQLKVIIKAENKLKG